MEDISSPNCLKNQAEAIVLSSYGGFDQMHLKTVEMEPLKPNEVLIQVKACGMNFSDLLTRQGVYTLDDIKPPFIMGLECSGIVEEIGTDVSDLKIGNRVMCWSFCYGMWSELINIPSVNCYKIPDTMSFTEAASFPIQYLTAYFAILDFGNLRPSQKVLIQCAAGGVGWAATQLAHTVENVIVYGTASASKHELIKGNGVDHPIDYRNSDFVSTVAALSPEGVDVILDCLAGHDFVQAQTLLKPMGRIIAIGITNMLKGEKRSILQNIKIWWQTKNVDVGDIIMKSRSVCGLNIAAIMKKSPDVFRDGLKNLLEMYEAKLIQPRIDAAFYFRDVVEATRRMTDRQNVGKIILLPKKGL